MIRVKRRLNSTDVVDALTDLFSLRGPPKFIRSDNGDEFIVEKVRTWIAAVGAKTAFSEPGQLSGKQSSGLVSDPHHTWESGSCESFNARFRDELLNGEIFYSLREAQIQIEKWRRHYNTVRPHSALGYRPPAPETIVPMDPRPTMHSHSTRTTQWGQSAALSEHAVAFEPLRTLGLIASSAKPALYRVRSASLLVRWQTVHRNE